MVYKSCPASEYAIWACFQTALPFPEENNGKKYDFSNELSWVCGKSY